MYWLEMANGVLGSGFVWTLAAQRLVWDGMVWLGWLLNRSSAYFQGIRGKIHSSF